MAKKTTKKKTAKKTTRKKAPTRKKPQATKMDIPQSVLDSMMTLVIEEGKTFDQAQREMMKLDEKADPEILAVACIEIATKISAVASFDKNEEIGASILRLKGVFAAAKLAGELTAAISAQTQINKLLALYQKDGDPNLGGGDSNSDAARELQLVEEHLRPLGLAAQDYPISGIARIAADRIRQLEAKG